MSIQDQIDTREPALFGGETPAFRPKPDGKHDPAGEAGWYLQRERESRGEELEDVGAATGIHPYHLEAIEYGDMTRMPGRIEAINMIGNYAQYLGFDAEPLVLHYAHFLPRPAAAPRESHPANPAPLSSAKVLAFAKLPKLPQIDWSRVVNMPGGAGGIVASVAGAIMLFAGVSWLAFPSSNGPALEQVAQSDGMPTATTGEQAKVKITEEAMPDAEELAGNGAPPEEEASASAEEALTEEEAASAGLNGLTAFIEENVPAEPAKKGKKAKKAAKTEEQIPMAGASMQTADGRIFGSENTDSRLVLRAKAPVWVRVEDQSGNVIMTQMLMKGDTYRVPAREGLVAIARDGGLLSYEIDGKEKGILGPPGEILVGRPLDLPKLESEG